MDENSARRVRTSHQIAASPPLRPVSRPHIPPADGPNSGLAIRQGKGPDEEAVHPVRREDKGQTGDELVTDSSSSHLITPNSDHKASRTRATASAYRRRESWLGRVGRAREGVSCELLDCRAQAGAGQGKKVWPVRCQGHPSPSLPRTRSSPEVWHAPTSLSCSQPIVARDLHPS